MEVEILDRPANTVAKLTFSKGDEMTTEGGSMIAMSEGVNITTTTHQKGKGSIGKAIKRMFSGESFFLNHYDAKEDGTSVYVAPTLSGDIMVKELKNETIYVQGSSFLAYWGDIDMDMKWQGFKGLFGGEGFFWLKMSGTGTVLINSFGMIYPLEVNDDTIVDSSHIVAYEEGLNYKITKVGNSWISSFLGGEGIVCRFTGKGKVWCQSHSPSSFGTIIGPLLKPREA